jgi:hypothetical protein
MYNKASIKMRFRAAWPGDYWGVHMPLAWWLPIIAIVLLAAVWLWRPRRPRRKKTPPAARLVQAKRRFHVQREWLEAKFLQLAASHAQPDAPRWTDCTFADDVAYVRNRTTGELSAFVAVTLATEELDRSTHDAADSVQAGTAVFRFDRDHWETDGRAILNLSPAEAVHYYRNDLEIVGEELAHRF